jgi:hypothetical protein
MKATKYLVTIVLSIFFGSLPFVAMTTIDVPAVQTPFVG